MKIRIAELEDLESIVEIYNQAVKAGQKTADTSPVTVKDRLQWFQNHTPEKYPIVVAEIENKVVGYLTISAYRPGRVAVRYTAEVSYYIHFDYHRKGIASKLLKHALDICSSLNIKTLFAILLDSNHGSYKLLEKYGFEKWGHMPAVADFDGVEVGHYYYGLRVVR